MISLLAIGVSFFYFFFFILICVIDFDSSPVPGCWKKLNRIGSTSYFHNTVQPVQLFLIFLNNKIILLIVTLIFNSIKNFIYTEIFGFYNNVFDELNFFNLIQQKSNMKYFMEIIEIYFYSKHGFYSIRYLKH